MEKTYAGNLAIVRFAGIAFAAWVVVAIAIGMITATWSGGHGSIVWVIFGILLGIFGGMAHAVIGGIALGLSRSLPIKWWKLWLIVVLGYTAIIAVLGGLEGNVIKAMQLGGFIVATAGICSFVASWATARFSPSH